MKFSVAYVKQNPVMFGLIFLVFGLLLWLMMNRNAAPASSTAVIGGGGPSDAQLAAATQVQLAQIGTAGAATQAQYQLAALQYQSDSSERMGALELQMQLAQIASDQHTADNTLAASVQALQIQTGAQVDITEANNQFMVDYATQANDAATTQSLINASLQRDLSSQQLEAYKFGTMATLAATLKSKGLAHTFFDGTLPGTTPAQAYNPNVKHGGGSGILSVIGSVVAPLPALVSRIG